MKKIIDYTKWAAAAIVIAVILQHFNAGKEITVFVKSLAAKISPWLNTAVYS